MVHNLTKYYAYLMFDPDLRSILLIVSWLNRTLLIVYSWFIRSKTDKEETPSATEGEEENASEETGGDESKDEKKEGDQSKVGKGRRQWPWSRKKAPGSPANSTIAEGYPAAQNETGLELFKYCF